MSKISDIVELEIQLFDQFIVARREGRPVSIETLAERLPQERREAFITRLKTTQAFQTIASLAMGRVRNTLEADSAHIQDETSPPS